MKKLQTTQETANKLLDDLAELYCHAAVSTMGLPSDEEELEELRQDCEKYAIDLFGDIMGQYEERFDGVWNIKVNEETATESNAVEKLITFLKETFPEGIQMFNTRNLVGDIMDTIYNEDDIVVDHCMYWDYVEIFGLTQEEFEKVVEECGY